MEAPPFPPWIIFAIVKVPPCKTENIPHRMCDTALNGNQCNSITWGLGYKKRLCNWVINGLSKTLVLIVCSRLKEISINCLKVLGRVKLTLWKLSRIVLLHFYDYADVTLNSVNLFTMMYIKVRGDGFNPDLQVFSVVSTWKVKSERMSCAFNSLVSYLLTTDQTFNGKF